MWQILGMEEPFATYPWAASKKPILSRVDVFATDNTGNQYLLNFSIYQATQLRQTISSTIKEWASLQLFKDKIKAWSCDRCQCQICSWYIANVGYF